MIKSFDADEVTGLATVSDSSGTAAAEVAVCIVTYKRTIGLSRCLESLRCLRLPQNNPARVSIIVVDNDERQSARPIVEAEAAVRFPVRYEVEPRRGIPFARNRAVALASACDFIAFVDDDEIVDANWLAELLGAQRRFDADIVAGPVLPIIEEETPEWLRLSGLFEKRRMASGTRISWASTANVLIKREVLCAVDGPFDERLAFTGGTDRFLTSQLARLGTRLVWCDEAIVRELIPTSRANFRWRLKRAYRTGNTTALCETMMPMRLKRNRLRIFARSALEICRHSVQLLPAIFKGRPTVVSQLAMIAADCGKISGLFGYRYEEYRTIHGT